MSRKRETARRVRVGIDTGGTFTDFIVASGGEVRIHKVLSTPRDPAEAVLRGLEEIGLEAASCEIVYGSTVATNALLERKGARTALVTTAGFEDLLEIGRQTRPHLYDLSPTRPPALVPAELRFGVDERLLYDGSVLKPLSRRSLADLRRRMRGQLIESVAVCLLFGFVNTDHERAVAEALEGLGVPVSCSHQILPEHREYERASTTAVNAYVAPVMGRYLGRLGRALGQGRFQVMQSNGGSISAARAAAEPVYTILSGPAGGVVAGLAVGRQAGFERVITFDMGGTSTDVSLCDGELTYTTEAAVGGSPVHVPMIDIHTVGAGGGSIARRDPGGALVVGPESAGADPGPICYGRGGVEPTVTDANLALGRLDGRWFLGGSMGLVEAPVGRALGGLARRLGVSERRCAEGIVEVVNTNMERAIRVISVERGHDPRGFTLVSFGGAGALHACDLAERLGMPRVVVPNHAGIASALGMLLSDVKRTYATTVMAQAQALTAGRAERAFRGLEAQGRREMAREGVERADLAFERLIDCRYVGQSYEISVPYGADYMARFHRLHESTYGHARPDEPVEVVALRVHATGRVPSVDLPKGVAPKRAPRPKPIERKAVVASGKTVEASVYWRADLPVGARLRGPALVPEYSATTWVPPGWAARVDRRYNLILERAR